MVISGLPPSNISSDGEQFQELCSYQLNLHPKIRSTLRLGQPTSGKTQPLLVNLWSPDDVDSIIRVAKDLRKSENQYTRDNIYINRHLTKAEAAAALNARSLRRQKEKAAAKTHENQQPNATTTTSVDNATPSIPPTTPGTSPGMTLNSSAQSFQAIPSQSSVPIQVIASSSSGQLPSVVSSN